MPRQTVLHYNPPADDGKTRCGKKLAKVKWTSDTLDCTCNNCLRLIEADRTR